MSQEIIDVKTLKKKCEEFDAKEKRAPFYDIAVEIVDKYPLQASIIILSVWNSPRFRYIVNNKEFLFQLKKTIENCMPLFEKLKDKEFQTVNFDEIGEIVKKIYNRFSKIKGVDYTGASKIMHLLNRRLFVMWDRHIRKEYKLKDDSAESYLEFQKRMQEMFKHIKWRHPTKTLPKAIDEYNYVTITLKKSRKK